MVPTTLPELRAQLTEFFVETYYVASPDELQPDTPLLETGILDSTGVLELVAHLEERYGISIGDEDIVPENMNSIDRLSAFIASRR